MREETRKNLFKKGPTARLVELRPKVIRQIGLEWPRDETMKIVNMTKEKSCTFCKKSQQLARCLIESPDQCTYICDECVVEPERLKLAAEEQENQKDASVLLPSRFSRFLQEHLDPKQLRCSFCQKRIRSRDLHVPATHPGTQVQICSECLVVCRQILRDETQRKHSSVR